MSDLNEKIEERWRQRRKKGYNWPKLIIMVIILVGIIYGMSILQQAGNVVNVPTAEVIDSTSAQTTPGDSLQ
jgi:hypothetical protein